MAADEIRFGATYADVAPQGSSTPVVELQKSMLRVYPNPANDKLNIDFGRPMKNAIISIFDLQGRQLLSKIIDGETEILDIQNLNKGMYILRLSDGSENTVMNFIKE